jgi:peptide deformylase
VSPAEENGHPDSALDEAEQPLEHTLDPEVAARRNAALAHVRTFGDLALRTRASEVESFDETLHTEIERMGYLMSEALGVGLAATQLGVMHRVLVYRTSVDAPLIAVVNPEFEWSSDEQEEAEEACLSLPGVAVDVERSLHIRVRAREETGEQMVIEASGLEARVIQHEIDHLDGVLILDRTSREQRKEALRVLREGWESPSLPGESTRISQASS